MKSKDVEMVMREARRMRAEARVLPRGEICRALEDAADKLEKIVRRLADEAASDESGASAPARRSGVRRVARRQRTRRS